MTDFWNRRLRAKSTNEYDFSAERRVHAGTSSLTSAGTPSQSGTVAHGLDVTPIAPVLTSHDGNTLATVQTWDNANMTVTLKKVDGTNLGTINYGWWVYG